MDLTPEERYTKRLELEKPVLDALLAWANETSAKTAPKSALGKALHYLREQWPYLVRYLEDGRLELSNNRAERSIKPFVMGRIMSSSHYERRRKRLGTRTNICSGSCKMRRV